MSELEPCDGCGNQGRPVAGWVCLEHSSMKAGNSGGPYLQYSPTKII